MSHYRQQSGIYAITNVINGKRLIGQSKCLKRRWAEHRKLLDRNSHCNPYLQNSWNKYGKDSFEFQVLSLCPVDILDSEEIRLIHEYKTTEEDFGYNLTTGGGRPVMSIETISRMKEAHKGSKNYWYGKHLSEEHKSKLRKAHVGMKPSKEAIEKMSKAQIGRVHSEETKIKIGLSNQGKHVGQKCSEETRRKMSESRKGEKNYWYHRPFPEEMRRKMSEAQKGEKSFNFGKTLPEAQRRKMSESAKLAWVKRKTKQSM